MRAGLIRTGGNRQRYATLLRKFAAQQRGVVDAMRTALSASDAATAERAAHSLKGAAGTLGASDLAKAAAVAEIAIKTGRGVEAPLMTLAASIDPLVAAISHALPEEGAGNGPENAAGNPESVKAPLSRLKQLLESDDGDAADFVIDARTSLAGVLTPGEIKTLTDSIGNFDFETALGCLSGIASRLSWTLKLWKLCHDVALGYRSDDHGVEGPSLRYRSRTANSFPLCPNLAVLQV